MQVWVSGAEIKALAADAIAVKREAQKKNSFNTLRWSERRLCMKTCLMDFLRTGKGHYAAATGTKYATCWSRQDGSIDTWHGCISWFSTPPPESQILIALLPCAAAQSVLFMTRSPPSNPLQNPSRQCFPGAERVAAWGLPKMLHHVRAALHTL